MDAFLDSLDIANRACDHCGVPHIATVTEDSVRNEKISAAYDKKRQAELERNTWRFAIRKVVLRPVASTTLLLNPSLYSNTATYLLGEVVRDANNDWWSCVSAANVGNTPGGNNEAWESYFGVRTAHLWDSTETYNRGEVVYKADTVTAGRYNVFLSLADGNTSTPDIGEAWSATTTYYADEVVSYLSDLWRSKIPFNLNVTPEEAASPVDAWTAIPDLASQARTWRYIGNTVLQALPLLHTPGIGPLEDLTTRNYFYLPNGFLKEAHQSPRAGSQTYLGAPTGLPYTDWVLEDQYLVTTMASPFVFRFVADFTQVRRMSAMFCEGLACSIAEAVCEPLTQSTQKLAAIASEYQKFMSEARLKNAIEIGTDEPPEDDYLLCRR